MSPVFIDYFSPHSLLFEVEANGYVFCITQKTVIVGSENKGLQLNAKKTECMIISKQSDIPVCYILCRGERIKQVNTYKCLVFTRTPDARCGTEIKKRIALSQDTFTKMKPIFTKRNIRIYTKINTPKAYVPSS